MQQPTDPVEVVCCRWPTIVMACYCCLLVVCMSCGKEEKEESELWSVRSRSKYDNNEWYLFCYGRTTNSLLNKLLDAFIYILELIYNNKTLIFVRKLVGEVGPRLKWNWKKIKNKHKEDTRNYVVRLLAYIHGRRQKENILLVKRNYKYYGILAHYPKSQYTQTSNHKSLKSLLKLLKYSHSLSKEEEINWKIGCTKLMGNSPFYSQNWLLK